MTNVVKYISRGSGGSGGSTTEVIYIAAADFTGTSVIVPQLVGKATTDFNIWGNSGAGTLFKDGDTYTFTSVTGEVDLPFGAEDIMILLYNP